jgi:enoyl-CoA hydratase/carnithine racemase
VLEVNDRVLSERRGDVRILTLNRPEKLNAADLVMQRQLNDRWREVGNEEGVGAVVLTGAGRGFCAGGDLSLLLDLAADDPIRSELAAIHRDLLLLMLSLPVPIVAAVQGPALGFGAELVALCDLVVLGRNACLGDPHVGYGVGASPGLRLAWPALTSLATAKELLLTGRQVDADEALRIGLANRVAAPGEELAAALGLAEQLAVLPRRGVADTRRGLNRALLEAESHARIAGEW